MKRININYRPLDKSVDIVVVSGSTVQQYNATIQEHVPDHSLVPLVLQPTAYIHDGDGVLTSGPVTSKMMDIHWYEGSLANEITDGTPGYSVARTTDDTNGRLTVSKNVPAGGLELLFRASFLDTRSGRAVPLVGSVSLVLSESAENNIHLEPSYPLGQSILATSNMTGLRISCPLKNGEREMQDISYTWQVKQEGAYIPIGEGNELGITGTGTDSVWIPAAAMSRRMLVKTIAALPSGQTYEHEHLLYIDYGNYEADILVPCDGNISPDAGTITLKVEFRARESGVIALPATFFAIEWYNQNGDKLGDGESLSLTQDVYSQTGFGVTMKVIEKDADTVVTAAQYTVTLAVSPEGAGTVSGGGTKDAGTVAMVSASANAGYYFSKWSDNNASASRQVTWDRNKTLTAFFEKLETELLTVLDFGSGNTVYAESPELTGLSASMLNKNGPFTLEFVATGSGCSVVVVAYYPDGSARICACTADVALLCNVPDRESEGEWWKIAYPQEVMDATSRFKVSLLYTASTDSVSGTVNGRTVVAEKVSMPGYVQAVIASDFTCSNPYVGLGTSSVQINSAKLISCIVGYVTVAIASESVDIGFGNNRHGFVFHNGTSADVLIEEDIETYKDFSE